ncbi:hypothetical protein ABBQ32_001432 [Trebouxia sp. C0010 RCD-2024]
MLSFVAGLLQTSKQERPTEHALEERTKAVFAQCDADSDGKLTKQDMYNYLVDRHINVSHIVQDKAFRILSGGDIYLTLPQLLQASCSGWLSDPISNRHSSMSITVLCRSRGSTGRDVTPADAPPPKQARQNANIKKQSSQHSSETCHATSAGAALEAALTGISEAGHTPGNGTAYDMSCTSRSAAMKSASGCARPAGKTPLHHTDKATQQASRLASTRKLEKEQAERAERIRAANL